MATRLRLFRITLRSERWKLEQEKFLSCYYMATGLRLKSGSRSQKQFIFQTEVFLFFRKVLDALSHQMDRSEAVLGGDWIWLPISSREVQFQIFQMLAPRV